MVKGLHLGTGCPWRPTRWKNSLPEFFKNLTILDLDHTLVGRDDFSTISFVKINHQIQNDVWVSSTIPELEKFELCWTFSEKYCLWTLTILSSFVKCGSCTKICGRRPIFFTWRPTRWKNFHKFFSKILWFLHLDLMLVGREDFSTLS